MNARLIFPASPFWFLALTLCLRTAPLRADPIRVTSWDLRPGAAAGTNTLSSRFRQSLVQDAAQSLKKLRPDVLLLQQVADWETCRQLAQALRPEIYQVAICSSFRDPHNRLLNRQVAILSKANAYRAWSEPWLNSPQSPAAPGGFAFAAIRLGDKNVGIFSVQLSDGASSGTADSRGALFRQAREESARQLVQQIAALQNWKTNRLEAFIVAGDFNTPPDDSPFVHEKTLSCLEQIGFENAFAGLPLEKTTSWLGNARRPAASQDYIFSRDAGLCAALQVTQTPLSEHYALTCDMDLTAPKAAAPPAALASATPPAGHPQAIFWLAAFLAGCLALFVLARKLSRRSEPQHASATLLDLQAKSGPSVAVPAANQIILAPTSESPPSVRLAEVGSAQTQPQTLRPGPDAGPLTTRMPMAVRAGVIANLSLWFKQKLVQRLVSDRAQLLATQQAAALKVLAVDQRLTRIEQHIQRRTREYEQRIDDLQKELLAATEENRELIGAKIVLLKAEMEKARLKAQQQNQERQKY